MSPSSLAQRVASVSAPSSASKQQSQSAPDQSKSSSDFDARDFGDSMGATAQPNGQQTEEEEDTSKVKVTVILNLPRMDGAAMTFNIAPFPTAPIKVVGKQKDLPSTFKGVKAFILATGYTRKQNVENYYPYGGIRWQNAYKAALKRSGRPEPHFIPTIYLWADALVPYAKEECERINDFEEERHERYKRACDEYDRVHTDLETDALRRGVAPIDLHLTLPYARSEHGRLARVRVPAGQWWVQGTVKRPGLTYYWQIPVEAIAGEKPVVSLTEDNALLIQGAW